MKVSGYRVRGLSCCHGARATRSEGQSHRHARLNRALAYTYGPRLIHLVLLPRLQPSREEAGEALAISSLLCALAVGRYRAIVHGEKITPARENAPIAGANATSVV